MRGIAHGKDVLPDQTVCLLFAGIGVWQQRLALSKHAFYQIHRNVSQVFHEMEAVGHLDYLRRCGIDKIPVTLAPVTADKADFGMGGNPLRYLLAIAAVEHGKHLAAVMVNGGTHVFMPLALGEVINTYISAGLQKRIALAKPAHHPQAGRGTRPDMLYLQTCRSRPGWLIESLMPDAREHLVAHTPVLRCKGKRFGEGLPAAAWIPAAEMADTENHHNIAAKQFRMLDFTQTVAVDVFTALAATGTYGTFPGGRASQGDRTGFLVKTFKDNPP